MGRKKALLIQLPVPSARWPRADANIPLAAGYLAAYALSRNPDWEVEILPWREADVYGDDALVRAVVARKPDIAGFSLYLWNSERSAKIAHALREAGIFTVGGGPEVDPSNEWLPLSGAFDLLIQGEGEAQFCALLSSFPKIPTQLPTSPLDLSKSPSPYLSGPLPPYPDKSAWLETVRGCPFSCDYCNYGKRFRSVRRFGGDWLAAHLNWFRENGANEIYLMDPSFNVRSDWEESLSALEGANRDGFFSFHCELSAEHLRKGDAARLAALGLCSAEVGLQSADKKVLKRVNREWNRRKWLSRMKELTSEGITLSVGIIAGLPGDTLESFEKTLSFVLNELPEAEIQLFPLAVLPGTALRERTEEEGLLHFSLPPYTVFSTPKMSAEDIRGAFALFEEATGHELDPLGNPALTGEWEGGLDSPYLSGARLSADKSPPPNWPELLASKTAVNFTLYIDGWRDGLEEEIARFASLAPHTALTIAIENASGREIAIARLIREKTPSPPYLRRHYSHLCPDIFPRIVFLLGHAEATNRKIGAIRESAEVVFTLETSGNWLEIAEELAKGGENVFVRGETGRADLSSLRERLGEDAEGIFFSDRRAQESFSSASGHYFDERRITL